jgi:hypothetical protein
MMKRKRPKKLCRAVIPVLEGIANDPSQPTDFRLFSVGALSRIAAGLPISSTALSGLLRVRESQKALPATPIPSSAKPKVVDLETLAETKPAITADSALALIRGQKGK